VGAATAKVDWIIFLFRSFSSISFSLESYLILIKSKAKNQLLTKEFLVSLNRKESKSFGK
jgi:hypothetical protein